MYDDVVVARMSISKYRSVACHRDLMSRTSGDCRHSDRAVLDNKALKHLNHHRQLCTSLIEDLGEKILSLATEDPAREVRDSDSKANPRSDHAVGPDDIVPV
jgi:hypothetical protein